MSRGSRIAWLVLLAVGATSAGATLRLQDIDQDSWPDTLAFHQLRFSVFRTTAPPLPADHPAGLDAEAILRDALRQNDFVGDFLHRDDAAEVKTVRSAAISLVRGSTTDREKVEHVLSWLASNWDFSVERSTVNAAELWARRQGKCETSGFLVGILATLGIQAREVSDSRFALAVEVRLENRWRVAYLFAHPPHIDERSMLEIASDPRDACIVYYWRDARGKLFRTKFWYEEQVDPIFRTADGISNPPPLSRLRVSY